jgi:D-glycero-D-manno-heptose 1,7-bisphosphate phosphatase
MTRATVFLDRDGTLIKDKNYLNDPEDIEYFPDAFDALRALGDRGFCFIVTTNQSGIPRGLVQEHNMHEIHRRIKERCASEGIEILDIYHAPYLPESNHPLRKPSPEMLELAARKHDIALHRSWMIGDKMIDVEAGHRAGCRAILVGGNDSPGLSRFRPPEAHVPDLDKAARHILASDI